jgi:hypothetical protein
MQLTTRIIFIYQEFRRCFRNSKYVLPINQHNLAIIGGFEKILLSNLSEESIGDDFIMDYLLFQFEWWSGKKSGKFFSRIPLIHQCFGKTAFGRWTKKNRYWKYWAVKRIKEPNNIDFDSIKEKLRLQEVRKDF